MKRLMLTALFALCVGLPAALGAQAPAPTPGDSLRLKVDGMVCSLCAYGVERRLKRIDEVERVKVLLDSGLVVVTLQPGTAVSDSLLREEVRRAGFAFRGVTRFRRAPGKSHDSR